MTHQDVIAQANRERAELIDRLSRGRVILARIKGGLEAEKLIAARTLGRDFPQFSQDRLNEINAFLAEGLFGEG